MSELILVRHGQARLFEDDYDRLSEIGEEQARKLGSFWISRRLTFDRVFTGPRKRQRETSALVARCFAQADLPWPEPVVLEELDEYDGDSIIRELLPVLRQRNDRLKELAELYERHRQGAERYSHFQRMFEAVTTEWVRGTIESAAVESFNSFHQRVRQAIEHVTSVEGSGRRIAVFTSGGPISVAVQLAAKAPEYAAMELNWRIRNCSLSQIVFSRGRFTLDSFNSIPHLDDPSLHTYR